MIGSRLQARQSLRGELLPLTGHNPGVSDDELDDIFGPSPEAENKSVTPKTDAIGKRSGDDARGGTQGKGNPKQRRDGEPGTAKSVQQGDKGSEEANVGISDAVQQAAESRRNLLGRQDDNVQGYGPEVFSNPDMSLSEGDL